MPYGSYRGDRYTESQETLKLKNTASSTAPRAILYPPNHQYSSPFSTNTSISGSSYSSEHEYLSSAPSSVDPSLDGVYLSQPQYPIANPRSTENSYPYSHQQLADIEKYSLSSHSTNSQQDLEKNEYSFAGGMPYTTDNAVSKYKKDDVLYGVNGSGPYTSQGVEFRAGEAYHWLPDDEDPNRPNRPRRTALIKESKLNKPAFRIGDQVRRLESNTWNVAIYTVVSVRWEVTINSFVYSIGTHEWWGQLSPSQQELERNLRRA